MFFFDRHVIIGIGLITLLATGAGLLVNGMSSRGIPFIGQWDVRTGAATARPDPDVDGREIKDIESAKAIFDRGDSLFIDARPEHLFREGRVKGAVSFPVHEFEDRIGRFLETYPDGETHMVVYCSGRACLDSHTLAAHLIGIGYSNTRVMIDGFTDWEAKGYPVEKDPF